MQHSQFVLLREKKKYREFWGIVEFHSGLSFWHAATTKKKIKMMKDFLFLQCLLLLVCCCGVVVRAQCSVGSAQCVCTPNGNCDRREQGPAHCFCPHHAASHTLFIIDFVTFIMCCLLRSKLCMGSAHVRRYWIGHRHLLVCAWLARLSLRRRTYVSSNHCFVALYLCLFLFLFVFVCVVESRLSFFFFFFFFLVLCF